MVLKVKKTPLQTFYSTQLTLRNYEPQSESWVWAKSLRPQYFVYQPQCLHMIQYGLRKLQSPTRTHTEKTLHKVLGLEEPKGLLANDLHAHLLNVNTPKYHQ